MRYRVEVEISAGGGVVSGHVYVEADSAAEAREEAAELIRESAIDTGTPEPTEG
jgi:hypothetical protein